MGIVSVEKRGNPAAAKARTFELIGPIDDNEGRRSDQLLCWT